MESPGKKFTDLLEIEEIQDTDLALVRNETGVKKAPLQKLSDYLKKKFIGWVFEDLPTEDKTILGAIKEQNSALVGKGRANQNYIDDSKETECKWLKKGNICQVSLIFTPLHTFGAEWILFSELPEAEQPQEIQYMAVTEDGKIEPGLIRVSGTTILSWYASQPMVGVPVKFGFTYITKS